MKALIFQIAAGIVLGLSLATLVTLNYQNKTNDSTILVYDATIGMKVESISSTPTKPGWFVYTLRNNSNRITIKTRETWVLGETKYFTK